MKNIIITLAILLNISCTKDEVFECDEIPNFYEKYYPSLENSNDILVEDVLEYIEDYELWVIVFNYLPRPENEIYIGENLNLTPDLFIEDRYLFYVWLDEPILESIPGTLYNTVEGCYLTKITIHL